MCFASVMGRPGPLIKSSQASQGRSGHSGDLGIHSCRQHCLSPLKSHPFSPKPQLGQKDNNCDCHMGNRSDDSSQI